MVAKIRTVQRRPLKRTGYLREDSANRWMREIEKLVSSWPRLGNSFDVMCFNTVL